MAPHNQFRTLTDREREVLLRVAEGKKNSDISKELCIEVGTVEQHLDHIYHKLGISRQANSPRTTAAMYALQGGLMTSEYTKEFLHSTK